MASIILAFITSFALCYIAIPSIIQLAVSKNLFDEPGDRHSHIVRTPSLGGVGIFSGMLFSIVMWTPFNYFGDLQYILCSYIIIFLTGIKDDIVPMSPYKKLSGELLAAAILVFKANIKLTSFYGIFGLYELHPIVSILISLFTIIVIINAFNLIDGINCLAGTIGILIFSVLGSWFFVIHRIEIAIVAFASIGAVTAFLKYNVTPARIFMGDTGALLLGLTCSILTILFIELHKDLINSPFRFIAAPAFAVSVLIYPLFDTLRVFIIRIWNKRSPFSADRNHIHHILLDLGNSHIQATIILLLVNIFFILLAIFFQHLGNLNLLLLMFALAFILSKFATILLDKKNLSLENSTI
jgi:UDP-GlcNAc:undecaprenyl-phosphate/decaprenyl-phosphate GlcNAc-1-phosphate transferase